MRASQTRVPLCAGAGLVHAAVVPLPVRATAEARARRGYAATRGCGGREYCKRPPAVQGVQAERLGVAGQRCREARAVE
jgi:hypothetical protein